jgi:ribosomal protein S18 acetylase RimI-like enzyme
VLGDLEMMGATEVTIREASEEDAPAIVALSEASKDELGPISQHRQWLTQQIEVGVVFVADSDKGALVGFVVFDHNPIAAGEHTTVYYLCIDPTYRRRGIGKRLMKAVAVDALLCGNRQITLKCPSHLPANQFYQSIGYTLEGSETGRKGSHLNVWTLSM